MGKPSSASVVILMMMMMMGEILIIGTTNLWGGVNSYFLYALSPTDRVAHLQDMQANGLKVARIFVVGVDVGAKGSSSRSVEELEPQTVGIYNDDVLIQIDTLMFEASQYEVKLLIALHDRYSLGCWRRDAYVTKYAISDASPGCDTALSNPALFYTDAEAQADFDQRIKHILTHRNPQFGNRTWGEINEAVFGFEPQNEAQGHMKNPDWNWTCRRASTMRQYISKGILIVTGGGTDFESSVVDNHFNCPDIDVVSIHYYGNDAGFISNNLNTTISKRKRVIMEEFGTDGSDAQRAFVLSSLIDASADKGVPWLPWEFVKPGSDNHNFEFWSGGEAWNSVACRAKKTLRLLGTFSWPEISSTSSGDDITCSSSGGGSSGDWVRCSSSSQCANFCCSSQYSDDNELKCTPGGTQCLKL